MRVSKAVFNQELRLEVMLFVAEHPTGTFTLTECSAAVGVLNPSSIKRPLESLLAAGLITKGSSRDRERPFKRVASVAWEFARELEKRATQPPTASY